MFSWTDDVVWTEVQIQKRGAALIAQKYHPAIEAALNRKVHGDTRGMRTMTTAEQTELNGVMVHGLDVKAQLDQLRIDNTLKAQAIAYEQAARRLAEVIASVGRLEQLYVAATYDEAGTELTPEIPYLSAIAAEPLQVEENTYDVDGNLTGTTLVDNPLVLHDVAERAAAQATIDTTALDAAVMAVVALRGGV